MLVWSFPLLISSTCAQFAKGRGEGWWPAGGSLPVHRQPIHPQILIRIVTATTASCTMNCTTIALYNTTHTTHCVVLVQELHHCSVHVTTIRCTTGHHYYWSSTAVTSQKRRGRPVQCQLSILQFLVVYFPPSPYFLPYLHRIFRCWSPRNPPPPGLNSLQLSPFDHLLPQDQMRRQTI